jgi:hypothetical protein
VRKPLLAGEAVRKHAAQNSPRGKCSP